MSTDRAPKQMPIAGPKHDPANKSLTNNALATTLFGKTRRQILAVLYEHPSERFYLRQLTGAAGVAVGAAQRELAELTSAGIIRRDVEGRQVYFQANPGCPVFAELQGIVRKTAARAEEAQSNEPPGTATTQPAPANPPSRDRAGAAASARLHSTTPNPAFVWMTRR